MISLKKYLDMDFANQQRSIELLSAVLESYRSLLLETGKSAARACPAVGNDLQKRLSSLDAALGEEITPALVRKTEAEIEDELQQWVGRSVEHLKAKANEVKELLVVLANTASSIVERDQRYSAQFSNFTAKLESIANLEDLGKVRVSLLQGAGELKTCVERMTQESKQSVAQLQAEVCTYETKLKTVEQLALRDPLTGLANRRNVEERIEWRIAHHQQFCVMVIDVDGFKQVNDVYGHVAGDNLLRQFAEELRSNSRAPDIVGRWGGDEFIVVVDCDLAGAKAKVERLRKWVLGDYTIQLGAGTSSAKIAVGASIGVAEWQKGETMQELLAHADSVMYRDKEGTRTQKFRFSDKILNHR